MFKFSNQRRKKMSLDSARIFSQKVQSDEELAKKLAGYKEVEDFCNSDIAKSEGFNFTSYELNLAREELSQEQLDNLHCHTAECNWMGG
jgi:predicted ribosomally synthesized peptide with nif11-like leader